MSAAPEGASPDRWSVARALAPYVVTALLFAAGLWAMQKLLAPVDLRAVLDQVQATPWSVVILALGSTLLAYLALAGYDWSALRYIGKPLPIPVVLTGGLMAYAFGNTIGLSAVSGGAVRWRIYSRLGLDGYDVAAVSTFAAVSFGIAATVVGLVALAVHPGALASILPFSPEFLRLAAIIAITAIVAPLVLASLKGGVLRLGRLSVRAPSLPVLGGQICFSAADIGFSALTLYVLLPSSDLDFLTFLAIFAAAVMAGVVSHVPGGVGVFEAVVIASMPSSMPVEQVAAALLLFRITYYLLPFALALVVLAVFELWRTLGQMGTQTAAGRAFAVLSPGLAAVAPLAPLVLAATIFTAGLWMSLSALVPPASDAAEAAEALLPRALAEGSALLNSALGAGLIVLALGVVRRSLGAWLLAIPTLAAGSMVALADGFDVGRAAVLAGGALVLLPFRHLFHRHSRLTHAALSPGWIVLVLSTVAAFGFVLFFAHRSTPYAHELWWQFALEERAPRAWRAGLVGSLLVGVTALALLLLAPRSRPGPADAAARAAAASVAAAMGDPGAARALAMAERLMLSPGGRAFVGFRVEPGAWVAEAGPQGEGIEVEEVAGLFADDARRAGARPVFAAMPVARTALAIDLGLTIRRDGAEAVALLGPAEPALPAATQAALTDAFASGLSFRLELPADPAAPSRAVLTQGGAEVAQARVWWAPGGPAAVELDAATGRERAEVLLAALVLRLRAGGCPAVSLARLAEGAAESPAWQAARRLGAVPRALVTAEPSTALSVARLR